MERRKFIITSVGVTAGLAIGGYSLLRPGDEVNPLEAVLTDQEVAITPYIIIGHQGITVITPRAEMGQGIQSTLAVLVAEELDIDIKQLTVIHGPPSEIYRNNILYGQEVLPKRLLRRAEKRLGWEFLNPRFSQLTGAQSSLRDGFVKMRKTGAAARTILLEAASIKFSVPIASIRTHNGHVVLPDGRQIAYTALCSEARKIQPSESIKLKPKSQWTQLGKSQPRVDMEEKCMGTAVYSIDVRLPKMLYGSVIFNPHIGGGVKSFTTSKAENKTGFVKAVGWDDGVIVIATNTWYAFQAAKDIEVEWNQGSYPKSMQEHRDAVEKALGTGPATIATYQGKIEQFFEEKPGFETQYSVPYLTHATMEPMNAVAWIHDGKLEIWAGNQNPLRARYYGSKISGIPEEHVLVHTTYMGGAFGRRLESDYIEIAVHAACAVKGTPVKIIWSREGDLQHGIYRPIASARFRGGVSEGQPVTFDLQVSAPSLFASSQRRIPGHGGQKIEENVDRSVLMGLYNQPYHLPQYRIRGYKALKRLLPVGWSRGVGETQNVFFHETAMDELAYKAQLDPMEMRLSLIEHGPSRAVLEAVRIMSGWGIPLPEGHARGLAFAISSDAATAQVVQISQSETGIHLEKVFIAVDVGIALDPRNIEAQVKSGVIFGLDSGINSEITVLNGAVVESNYHQYPLLRFSRIPEIEVHIHESGEEIFGVGEAGVPTNPPALGNAIFALTGKRIRELPFRKSIRFA
jgi:isoquinoline 1-oxidoreductase beta subunit